MYSAFSEFEKLGGTIKAQYVDDDINNIILQSFGGDMIDRETYLASEGVLNGEEAIAFGEWWQSLFDRGLAPGTSQDGADRDTGFIDGKYAFYTRPQDGFIERLWKIARSSLERVFPLELSGKAVAADQTGSADFRLMVSQCLNFLAVKASVMVAQCVPGGVVPDNSDRVIVDRLLLDLAREGNVAVVAVTPGTIGRCKCSRRVAS